MGLGLSAVGEWPAGTDSGRPGATSPAIAPAHAASSSSRPPRPALRGRGGAVARGLRARACVFALGLSAAGRRVAGQENHSESIETAQLYGNVNEYAYYFTELFVGAPVPQKVSVIVDTGSSLCGFPCEGCGHCGHHIDPLFDAHASGSARFLSCGDECLGSCRDGRCGYTQSYTEGSSMTGLWFEDLVQLGDPTPDNPPVNASLGCHIDERNLFYTQRVNGIMGMAPHENGGRPTILQDLFVDKKHVDTGKFAICLSEWGGRLAIGGHDPADHRDGSVIQWLQLLDSGYYSVAPVRLSMDGVELATGFDSFGSALVDSGTTFTYFPEQVHASLVQALEARCGDFACRAVREGGEDGCWRLSGGATQPDDFPGLALSFDGGVLVTWPARAYLFQRGDPSLWCQAFASNGQDANTVLGISWMLHKDVIFDLKGRRLGIVEADCPQHMRPGDDRSIGSLSVGGMSMQALAAKALNVAWVVAAVGAVASLAWFVYMSYCDEDASKGGGLYHVPQDLEVPEETRHLRSAPFAPRAGVPVHVPAHLAAHRGPDRGVHRPNSLARGPRGR